MKEENEDDKENKAVIGEGTEWRSCPYQEEMNRNYDDHYCKCTDNEARQCALDV